MKQGYIKIARKLFDTDELWLEERPRTRFEAWLDLLELASWADGEYATGYGLDKLKRGQFVASLRWLASRWRWPKRRVERFILWCQSGGRIRGHQRGQHGTVYTIVNYNTYQAGTTARGTPKGTQGGQQGDKVEGSKAIRVPAKRKTAAGRKQFLTAADKASLANLKRMRGQGLMSTEEYERKRAKITGEAA